VQEVQAHLAAHGFPCPRPLGVTCSGEARCATLEEWRDEGEYRDAHEPEVRRALARRFARLHERTGEQGARPRRPFLVEQESALWPRPHNALFDFEATTRGAEWIDEIAREAQDRAPGKEVVSHTDWSVKHFRFDGLRPTVIYDWDSLHTGPEPHLVGIAAATFTYTEHLPVRLWPDVHEARAFLDEYEAACRAPWTAGERRAAEAAALYSAAYGARCLHAVGRDADAGPVGAYAAAFL
jgi:hypothetical protein